MKPDISLNSLNGDREMIKKNPEKILSVLATHHIAMWEYDIPTGQCSFTEDYFRILGLDKMGIVFRDIDDSYRFTHPADVFPYRIAFGNMLASTNKSAQIVVRYVGENGRIIWLEDHFLSCGENDGGQPEKILAYTTNVTSRYEKEGRIKLLEERNKKIIEALPEFIFIFDDDFFIRDVLASSDTILLHPVEVLRGADGRSIYSPETSELFIRNIHKSLEDGQLREIEYPLVIGEDIYYFQARIAPFEDNKVLALIHDISERVHRSEELIEAKQRAEEVAQMKSVFLANMSHEIRTPLNAIVGFSEILALTEDEGEKKEYVEIIQKSSNLLLQLINDILDLSRIESGKSEMNMQPIEVNKLIKEIGKIERLKMKERVTLNVIFSQQELWITTDRNRLMQVLFNFLSNAIKNTEKGSITIGIAKEENWLKFYVSDTGCGISKEKLPLIFARFEKLNDFIQGTGLGLSICKSIVERLGGHIQVDSELGEGSTFALYLPFEQQL